MTRRLGRAPLLVLALVSMVWGVWLGLLRIGWPLPLPWTDQLILHGPLMISGFLGTVIGLERAVGLGRRWAYAAPACSGAGALVLVFGPPSIAGPALITIASIIVTLVFVEIVRRQPALFSIVMLAGTAAWSAGNVWWAMGATISRVVFWWIAFVVLTIAGERLELNRVLRLSRRVQVLFIVGVAVLVAGVVLATIQPTVAARVAGLGLLALALWLARYDVATRTIRQRGLTRFMAVCLLAGYVWLGLGGVMLLALDLTSPGTVYDAVLHAVFVGFVLSMIFGHAPIVFPAVLGVALPYRPWFYLHAAVLHLSLVFRVMGDLSEVLGRLRAWGGMFNAVALALFIVNTAGSITLRTVSHDSPQRPQRAQR